MKDSILRRARAGAAIVPSSHLLHLLEEVCSHVLILKKGERIAGGTMAEVHAQFSDGNPSAKPRGCVHPCDQRLGKLSSLGLAVGRAVLPAGRVAVGRGALASVATEAAEVSGSGRWSVSRISISSSSSAARR